jgi:hypothetical protein
MNLDDERWKALQGGYRMPYDPRPALEALRCGTDVDAAWAELWEELHHQGDVGEASYAAIPVLVEIQRTAGNLGWNLYELASCIEIERHRKNNPPMPVWLADEYESSWESLVRCALDDLRASDDPLLVQTTLTTCALGRGQLKLGALILHLDPSEIDEFLEERAAWSELYSDDDDHR